MRAYFQERDTPRWKTTPRGEGRVRSRREDYATLMINKHNTGTTKSVFGEGITNGSSLIKAEPKQTKEKGLKPAETEKLTVADQGLSQGRRRVETQAGSMHLTCIPADEAI